MRHVEHVFLTSSPELYVSHSELQFLTMPTPSSEAAAGDHHGQQLAHDPREIFLEQIYICAWLPALEITLLHMCHWTCPLITSHLFWATLNYASP